MSDPDHETASTDNDGGAADEQAGTGETTTSRWITDPVLDADLPGDVRTTLGDIVGVESVATLEEWTTEIRRLTDGGAIEIDDLCHAETETPHWGEMDGERYYFLCFYDAVLLSALADHPVDILTESPDGTVVQAHATGTSDLRVTPPEAVVSFGVEREIEPPPDGDLSPEDLYAAVCPYVRAFPDRDAYEAWARTAPAATVAMSLSGATEVAAALVA
jgi:hypothetical protein